MRNHRYFKSIPTNISTKSNPIKFYIKQFFFVHITFLISHPLLLKRMLKFIYKIILLHFFFIILINESQMSLKNFITLKFKRKLNWSRDHILKQNCLGGWFEDVNEVVSSHILQYTKYIFFQTLAPTKQFISYNYSKIITISVCLIHLVSYIKTSSILSKLDLNYVHRVTVLCFTLK